jgi:hypothetical protein
LIADAAMPALTAIAKPRIVSLGLTWRESVIPTPTTGNDSPNERSNEHCRQEPIGHPVSRNPGTS